MKLYGMRASGNCYKPLLVASMLGLELEWVETDLFKGETRTADFLAKNPNGKVPLLELDDGRVLPESNAILCYLAEGSPLLPQGRFERAEVLQWLFFEQYSHEPYIAVARNIRAYQKSAAANAERLAQCDARGAAALDVMERRLAGHSWLTDSGPTAADLALFAYTHVADEGGFELARWPGVAAWVARVAALPGIRGLR
jgi:glutathione S-transferase